MKTCGRCKTTYGDVAANFGKCSRLKDGYRNECKKCRQVDAATYYIRNKEEIDRRNKAYAEANKANLAAYRKAYKLDNKEKIQEYNAKTAEHRKSYLKQWRQANKHKLEAWKEANKNVIAEKKRIRLEANRERIRAEERARRKLNLDKDAAKSAKRRAATLQATPAWANPSSVQSFYSHARLMTEVTGELYQVDHIDPLASKLVCGLHCEANLRVIKAQDNIKKGNKFKPYTLR